MPWEMVLLSTAPGYANTAYRLIRSYISHLSGGLSASVDGLTLRYGESSL